MVQQKKTDTRKTKNRKRAKRVNDDLFKQITHNMDPEEVDRLLAESEAKYKGFDEAIASGEDTQRSMDLDRASYIIEALFSGLNIEDLEDDERALMDRIYGDAWRIYLGGDEG